MSTGLLDTSVILEWDDADVAAALPDDATISSITLAELAAGPHRARTSDESARRQILLQQVEATFDPIAFDVAAARSFGQMVAAVAEHGRSHRRRIADLLIAATAHANGLDLYTRNPDDLVGLERLLSVVAL